MNDFKKRIERLTPKQKELLRLQLGKNRPAGSAAGSRLAAYVVGTDLNPDFIRERLAERLPEYMVPSKIVPVESIPKLPNGKIDLRSLSEIDIRSKELIEIVNAAAPTNETQKALTRIWKEVLRSEKIGINDNFFEIGGDSILSIRIVGLARQEGITLEPNQLFENQTIAELARVAVLEKDAEAECADEAGEIQLTPIQHWFFDEHREAPNFWHLGVEFALLSPVNKEITAKAISYIADRHDALRLRFHVDAGIWKASIAEPGIRIPQRVFDLADYSESERSAMITKFMDSVVSGIDMAQESLFQAVYFKLPGDVPDRVTLFAHHLQIDGFSWEIVARDFVNAIESISIGREPIMDAKTASFADWSKYLGEIAGTDTIRNEMGFWEEQIASSNPIPTDFEKKLPIREKEISQLEFSIDEAETATLMDTVAKEINVRPNELLVTAFLETLHGWTGDREYSISFERHGRLGIGSGPDLSDSVGWFTSFFPLKLVWDDERAPFSRLESVKDRLRGVPNGGLGYGLLRYSHPDESVSAALNFQPEIIFNYLGNSDQSFSKELGEVRAVTEGMRHPESERFYLLEVNTFIERGRLIIRCSFSKEIYRIETIASLLKNYEKNFRELIKVALNSGEKSITPSDFPEADMDQTDLDNLLGDLFQ